MNKLVAEFIGTLVLVLIGCGAVVLGGEAIGQVGIAFAFGLAIVAMAYAIGPISGCHINPAVSLAFYVDGRMELIAMIQHWVAQFAGALAGALILWAIVGSNASLGQNGWGPGYLGEYSMLAALIFEVVFTAIFVVVILGSTGEKGAPGSPLRKPVHCAAVAISRVVAASPESCANRKERAMAGFYPHAAREERPPDRSGGRIRSDLENPEAVQQSAQGTAGQRRDDEQPELGQRIAAHQDGRAEAAGRID